MPKKEMTITEFARKGNKARIKKYGKDVYSEMGKRSAEVRKQAKLDKEAQK